MKFALYSIAPWYSASQTNHSQKLSPKLTASSSYPGSLENLPNQAAFPVYILFFIHQPFSLPIPLHFFYFTFLPLLFYCLQSAPVQLVIDLISRLAFSTRGICHLLCRSSPCRFILFPKYTYTLEDKLDFKNMVIYTILCRAK